MARCAFALPHVSGPRFGLHMGGPMRAWARFGGDCAATRWMEQEQVNLIPGRAGRAYRSSDIAAAISSGSFRPAGMVVAPCSMKTVSGIATSFSDNLLLRAV